jgi:hypothetical protein
MKDTDKTPPPEGLAPCPFCGKVAISCYDEANQYGAVARTYARCPDDDCAGRVSWMPVEMWSRRATPPPVKGAASDILAERERQKAAEGWTEAHDNEHGRGDLARNGAAYAVKAYQGWDSPVPADLWTWDEKWWKPKDARKNLVRAAALILAEIERHDRIEAPKEKLRDSSGHRPLQSIPDLCADCGRVLPSPIKCRYRGPESEAQGAPAKKEGEA